MAADRLEGCEFKQLQQLRGVNIHGIAIAIHVLFASLAAAAVTAGRATPSQRHEREHECAMSLFFYILALCPSFTSRANNNTERTHTHRCARSQEGDTDRRASDHTRLPFGAFHAPAFSTDPAQASPSAAHNNSYHPYE